MQEQLTMTLPLALAGAADKPWVETAPGQAWSKLLWADTTAGAWATLYWWKKGYVAQPHVHLSDAHLFVLSGRLQVRDGIYGPGDYGYEPNGAEHGATTTLEDCTYFFICNGPLRIDADPATGRAGYEVSCADIVAMHAKASAGNTPQKSMA